VGSPYSFQFTSAGGTGPYTYSVPPGNLPDGLTMNDSGLITGTPTSDIPTTFTVTVTDSLGQHCGKAFTVTPAGDTCGTVIAAIPWFFFDNDSNFDVGWVVPLNTGANASFAANTPGPFGIFCTVQCAIANTTAVPITVRFTASISSIADTNRFEILNASTGFSSVITQNWPFTGVLFGDVTIGPGVTNNFFLNCLLADTGGPATASGTVVITCVP
jgi:hypothetical protein